MALLHNWTVAWQMQQFIFNKKTYTYYTRHKHIDRYFYWLFTSASLSSGEAIRIIYTVSIHAWFIPGSLHLLTKSGSRDSHLLFATRASLRLHTELQMRSPGTHRIIKWSIEAGGTGGTGGGSANGPYHWTYEWIYRVVGWSCLQFSVFLTPVC